jgi:hypothetical protein
MGMKLLHFIPFVSKDSSGKKKLGYILVLNVSSGSSFGRGIAGRVVTELSAEVMRSVKAFKATAFCPIRSVECSDFHKIVFL